MQVQCALLIERVVCSHFPQVRNINGATLWLCPAKAFLAAKGAPESELSDGLRHLTHGSSRGSASERLQDCQLRLRRSLLMSFPPDYITLER